ncbi:MAG: CatB-related O-acetyltransferase [Lachnospiraceae bacterium]|nr:CatB-related O-acetyltransferase [Lachnospiraceae bacterium]
MFGIATKIKVALFQIKWKRKYKGINGLLPKTIFPFDVVIPGKYSYGELNIVSFNWKSKVLIGNYVSIAQNVTFLIDADHYINHISTYPFKAKLMPSHEKEAVSKGDIIIEDDVWIGYGSTIMSGVHIGQGAIVAAGSVVTKDVPPYAIVGGVPAKVIKYRFGDDIINNLIKLDYKTLDIDTIKANINNLYEEIDAETDLTWFPKKNEET